jgi:pyruvate-formate lyase-activating enzyme
MWKVCPIQGRQLLDVRPEDIFRDFRICKTYRSGGGYDKLPLIIKKRRMHVFSDIETQFVVQLYGCNLRCPYCYVTEDGVFGKYIEYLSKDLLFWFHKACVLYKCGIFHLMGGAPALYIYDWPDLLEKFPRQYIFHSDLMLTDRVYTNQIIKNINIQNSIYAVNIKGITDENYFNNTGRKIDWEMFWSNLGTLVDEGLNFYLTFTNPDLSYVEKFERKLISEFGTDGIKILKDSFVIDLVNYNALKEGSAFKEEKNGFITSR